MSSHPDLVVMADTIHTMTDAPPVTALGITNGRITHLGTRAEAKHWGQAWTVDYGSASIIPGLLDAHTHPVHGLQLARGIFVGDAATPQEAARILAEASGSLAPGEWAIGWGLKQTVFAGDAPNGRSLDQALPGRKAVVTFFDGHASIASQPALAAAGIARGQTFDEGGQIVADSEGRPTGFLREISAMEAVTSAIPAFTFEDKVRLVREILEGMAGVGLTGAEVMDLEDPDSLAIFDAIEADGDLPVRLRVAPWILSKHGNEQTDLVISLQGRSGRRYTVRGAKLMIDGTIDNGTAWLYRPDSEGEGLASLYDEPQRYVATLRRLDAAGIPTATHAIGERGIRFVIDAITDLPAGGPRHRIEHIEEITDQDLQALAACGASASMQPTHCTHFLQADHSDAWSRRLGDERTNFAFRLRDVKDTGIGLSLGSDWPIAPYDPREIMADARTRRHTKVPGSRPILPKQGLTAYEALEGYTVAVHESTGSEGGRLRPGVLADLTVFGADPLALSPEELVSVPILATYVDGERI